MDDFCKKTIIVLGESDVGKTSLLKRFCTGTFKTSRATSVDLLLKDISVNDRNVRLELWDTGGDERFRAVVKTYYRRADGVLLVYDVNDLRSFQRLPSWLQELRDVNETAIVLLVGNKKEDEDKAVSDQEIKKFTKNENLDYIETSARNDFNVNETFALLVEKLLNVEQDNEIINQYDIIRLEDNTPSAAYNFINRFKFKNNGNSLPPIAAFPFDITPLHTNLPKKQPMCLLA